MPIAFERKLKAEAHRRHFGKKRTNRYVYGTLYKMGYRFGRKKHIREVYCLRAQYEL